MVTATYQFYYGSSRDPERPCPWAIAIYLR